MPPPQPEEQSQQRGGAGPDLGAEEKNLPDTKSRERLYQLLHRGWGYSADVADWLEAGRLTGLRPVEWFGTQYRERTAEPGKEGTPLLSVPNAKTSASRGNGLRRHLQLSTDRQFYPVNWSERTDRRPVVLHGVVTADQGTGYVLCARVNYDPDVAPAKLEEEAALAGDYVRYPAYRSEARLWLPGELAGASPTPVVGATAPVTSD